MSKGAASLSDIVICPKCGQENPGVDVHHHRAAFCRQCRFPLMLIAHKYQMVRELGKGGFGVVYEARHVNLMRDEERVVKVLRPELIDDDAVGRRFMREVQVTSVLSQSNHHIVRIYDDFGFMPDFGFYYVMEYLSGLPLNDLLKRARGLLPLKVCYHLFDQLCSAIHAAHLEGIIHRDLKPANLFVIKHMDDSTFLKVIDFGIAKVFESSAEASSLTQGVVGTPAYMAPEQCMNEKVGPATDVYAMGTILFELLVGHIPFVTPEKPTRTAAELITAQLMHKPPSVLSMVPEGRIIPRALSDLVEQMLEKEPSARFDSVKSLQEAFRQSINVDRDTLSLRPFIPAEDLTLPELQAAPETARLRPEGPPPTARAVGGMGRSLTDRSLVAVGLPSVDLPSAEHISMGEAATLDGEIDLQTGELVPANRSRQELGPAHAGDSLELAKDTTPTPRKAFPEFDALSPGDSYASSRPRAQKGSSSGGPSLVAVLAVGVLIFLGVGGGMYWLRQGDKDPAAHVPRRQPVRRAPARQAPGQRTPPPKDPVTRRVPALRVPERRHVPRPRPHIRRPVPRRRQRRPRRVVRLPRPPGGCPLWRGGKQVFLKLLNANERHVRVAFRGPSAGARLWRRSQGICVGYTNKSTRVFLEGKGDKSFHPCQFALRGRRLVSIRLMTEDQVQLDGQSYCLK